LTIINPGDRIEVLAMPFAVHVGKQGIVEGIQDLTREGDTMARLTVRSDAGDRMLLIVPPDRIKVIR
jgi:hypothetical protein